MFTIYTKSFITKFLFITLFLSAANALFGQITQEEAQQVVPGEITEFTYQGRLLDNNLPANSTYDFQFRLTDGSTRTIRTNQFGYFQFDSVQVGRVYLVRAESRNFTFTPESQLVYLLEARDDLNFTAAPKEL